MLPKSRPSFGNTEVLSTTHIERSQATLPRINGLIGDLGPNEPTGVGVTNPADLYDDTDEVDL